MPNRLLARDCRHSSPLAPLVGRAATYTIGIRNGNLYASARVWVPRRRATEISHTARLSIPHRTGSTLPENPPKGSCPCHQVETPVRPFLRQIVLDPRLRAHWYRSSLEGFHHRCMR